VSIPFATLCDPLAQTKIQWDILLDKAMDLAKRTKASRMEIRAHSNPALLSDSNLTPHRGFKNHYLCLDRSPRCYSNPFMPRQCAT
jgi:hypothetical protein